MSKYYKYFKGKIKENGVLHIDSDEYLRLLDIVFLEGGLRCFESLKEGCRTSEDRQKYEIDIYRLEKKLSGLVGLPTHKQEPQNVLNFMITKSRE